MHTISPIDPFLKLRQILRGEHHTTRLIADSLDLEWRSLEAAIVRHTPLPEMKRGMYHPSFVALTYHLSGPTNLTRKMDDGTVNNGLVAPRQLCFTPADTTTSWSHSDYPEVLRIYLPALKYESAVEEILDCDSSDAPLLPRFAVFDPLLEQLATAVMAALRAGTTEPLYMDAIANTLAAHLALRHSSHSSSTRMLPRLTMRGPKMQRVVDYIEANLGMNLTLDAMAAEANISPVYFARAFKDVIGQSPHRYVIARRVERAKELLRNTDMPLAHVASTVGFFSPSHLSRWFRHHVGVRPGAYRRQV
jgi:AraC family transcriptional regulator